MSKSDDGLRAFEKEETEMGYYRPRTIIDADDELFLYIDCIPGRPGCSTASVDNPGAKLLVVGADQHGGNKELDAIAKKINEFATPLFHAHLTKIRRSVADPEMHIVKLLGPDGFYLAYGKRSEGGARFAVRGWARRWLRHWLMPWRHD